ncbi:MAG: (Fe-S)-binding protein [Deltaproteobacteria bacterium]|nr:(Fe-S)-binding protein [Deltaproteobacteria bacterium]
MRALEEQLKMKAELLKEDIEKCVRCGTCRSICPTFRVIAREGASARGKLTLIQAYLNGGLGLTPEYAKQLNECTLCGSCRDSCPNGVDTVNIIRAGREDVFKKEASGGVAGATAKFILKNVIDSTRLMPLALKFASRVQGVLFKESTAETGLISRFSLPFVGGNRLIPPLAKTFFLDLPAIAALSGIFPDDKGARGLARLSAKPRDARRARPYRVAFYAGCGVNYLMPEVGIASIDAVKRAGAEVKVPGNQVCCGMPLWSMGDTETAKTLALKNIEAFENCGADYIVTSCATCTYGLKTVFKQMLSGEPPEIRAKAEAFAEKVMDITELLASPLNAAGMESNRAKREGNAVVTYHDPCHLGRGLGIRDEPRELIRKSKGVTLKEVRGQRKGGPCRRTTLTVIGYQLPVNGARLNDIFRLLHTQPSARREL